MSAKIIKCNHTGSEFSYEIQHGLNLAYNLQADKTWSIERAAAFQQLISDNPTANGDNDKILQLLPQYGLEDFHWLWINKALSLNTKEYEWFYFLVNQEVQAICITFHPKDSRIDRNDIFYIDYLAVAQWNRTRPNYIRKFSGIGKILLTHASLYSINTLKYRPGFCLHSLAGAMSFYLKLGMTDFGPDPDKQDLHYLEASKETSLQLVGDQQ